MKSAYELAMERLAAKDGDAVPVSDALRRELAAIDAKYKARVAEREIYAAQTEARARAAGQTEIVVAVRDQLRSERLEIEAECEAAKERARRVAR